MATSFPGALDSFTNPSASDALDSVTVGHAGQHADLNDAMEAVQAKLGVGAGTIGEWQSWTPVIEQGATTFGVSVQYAAYTQVNDLVVAVARVTLSSGTGVSSNSLTSSVPVNIGTGAISPALGSALVYDANLTDVYSCTVYGGIGEKIIFQPSSTISWNGIGNTSKPITFTTSDQITFAVMYQAE